MIDIVTLTQLYKSEIGDEYVALLLILLLCFFFKGKYY
jgi:hypothetical protein